MKINKYPDGTSYVTLEKSANFTFTFKLNSYEDLWHLNQFVEVYNHNYKGKPTIIIPNLIDSQADRRFSDNQSSGLKLVCNFLNGMNANFKIFHPHNPEVVEAMMDNVEIIDNEGFIRKVFEKLDRIKSIDNTLILMSSDAGGFKPLMKLCDTIGWEGETFSASKARTKDGMRQLIDREDFKGKDILIIDDISVFGGTFKGLSKMLKERNCGKLYLAVSHMTVKYLLNDPVTNYFDTVYTTNSKFDEYWFVPYPGTTKAGLLQPENLKIIKLF
tara:strand:+ start:15813 stop:16631 length:819 start_codon:yes stop_codon:yes gene_type:complete